MPNHHQLVIDAPVTTRGSGRSSTTDLLIAYPASPTNTLSDADIKDLFINTVLAQATGGIVNDGGHTFGEVAIDYAAAPNTEEVVVGGAGLPGNPHAPNIVSPGEGVDPTTMPDGSAITLAAKGQGGPFPGYVGGDNPSVTSANVTPLTIGSLSGHGHTA